jgi:hypothetical protein
VVDEADEMLSRGFETEVAAVIQLAYQAGVGVQGSGFRGYGSSIKGLGCKS